MLPSILILGLVALVAGLLARHRQSPPENSAARIAASRVLALAVGIQAIHFVEEAVTGFHERFPALFGLPAMSFAFFVVFNVVWLGIWIASVPGIRRSRPAAFFAAWFLAIAGTLNGIAHPLMALADGRYFPGLVSSSLIGVVGVWLCLLLYRATGRSIAY